MTNPNYKLRRPVSLLWMLIGSLLFAGGVVTAQESDVVERYADVAQGRTDDGAFVLGDPDAPVTVVEFADFMCPHCQDYETMIASFVDEFVLTGQARFEYRMFPIVDPVYSPLTAQVAECADTVQAGMFWPAHDVLYELASAGEVDENIAKTVATRLELDAKALAACAEQASQYATDTLAARELGINGTPAVMVRTADGDFAWLTLEGQTLNQGGVALNILQSFMEGDERITTTPPDRLLDDRMLADTSLLNGDPCATPCWRGITPGETSWEDALAILQDDTTLSGVQTQDMQNGSGVQAFWETAAGQACCQMVTQDGQIVDFILLRIAPELTIGEIIEQHGEPTYLSADEYTPKQAILNLYYPDVPMVVYVFVTGAETGEVTESSEVLGVLYISTDKMPLIMESANLHAWQGYASFQTYAQSPVAELS
jgi:protein-disulfide isomerase